jgi:hypothetical protein
LISPSRRLSPLGSGDNRIDELLPSLRPEAWPRVPIPDEDLGTVAIRDIGEVGLIPMAAIEAPEDQAHASRGGVAERHRRAGCYENIETE